MTKNRGLIAFDLAGKIPLHAEITSVALTLTVVKVPLLGPNSTFELRRVLQPWNEAEATWNRSGTNASWSEPGASAPTDFSTDVSATTGVSGLGNYTFGSTSNLVADVQAWVDAPGPNFGWIVLTQSEDVAMSARRFASRHASTNAPALVIEYLLPPAIADVTRHDSNMTCHFTVEAGYNYTVEYAQAFPPTNWLTLTNFSAKVASFEATVTNSFDAAPSRFLRLSRVVCNCR